MSRILVIDDSKFQRSSLAKKLASLGHEVKEAGNGKEGLEIIGEDNVFDCILSDLHMPEMDGFELLRNLKEQDNKAPVIVISADIQEETQQEISELGGIGFITKPIKIEVLKEALEKVLAA